MSGQPEEEPQRETHARRMGREARLVGRPREAVLTSGYKITLLSQDWLDGWDSTDRELAQAKKEPYREMG